MQIVASVLQYIQSFFKEGTNTPVAPELDPLGDENMLGYHLIHKILNMMDALLTSGTSLEEHPIVVIFSPKLLKILLQKYHITIQESSQTERTGWMPGQIPPESSELSITVADRILMSKYIRKVLIEVSYDAPDIQMVRGLDGLWSTIDTAKNPSPIYKLEFDFNRKKENV